MSTFVVVVHQHLLLPQQHPVIVHAIVPPEDHPRDSTYQ
jgi:hypothetical protein